MTTTEYREQKLLNLTKAHAAVNAIVMMAYAISGDTKHLIIGGVAWKPFLADAQNFVPKDLDVTLSVSFDPHDFINSISANMGITPWQKSPGLSFTIGEGDDAVEVDLGFISDETFMKKVHGYLKIIQKPEDHVANMQAYGKWEAYRMAGVPVNGAL